MGNTVFGDQQTEEKTTTDNEQDTVDNQPPVAKATLTEKLSDVSNAWNPAFNEFQFGDSPQNLPQAGEFPHDVVKYFWLKLNQFGDKITKFIPPNTTINEGSYICFLFIDQKLFNISIRLFYDDIHPNYDDIIQAYAKAVNTPINDTEEGKEFYYEDNRIIYCSCFHSDKNHVIIEVIRKGQTTDGENTFRHLSVRDQRRKSSMQRLLSPQPHKYDIMISYSHKDKEFAHRLYYRLLEDKFRVWIDLENMYGPIVERMAEAIENSKFVLICMSNAYKSSSYCQLEAEYAFKFQTCLIPIVAKKDFTQTGWLGMLCGLRLQIDFTKTTFDEAYQLLCTEMQRYRRQPVDQNDSPTPTE